MRRMSRGRGSARTTELVSSCDESHGSCQHRADQPSLTAVDGATIRRPSQRFNTLLVFDVLYPGDPLRRQGNFPAQQVCIIIYLTDHVHGGWYMGGLDQQPATRTDLRVDRSQYGRQRFTMAALMNVARRLEHP